MTLENMTSSLFRLAQTTAAVVLTALCLQPLTATAQVYRTIGADGKVTFSDKPPSDSSAKVATPGAGSINTVASMSLPFELRQVAAKYPVTLYTGNECSPCGAARSMLTSRGVPFTEKTVTSNDDMQALQRLGSDNSLPFLTLGSQQLKGFADSEWAQYLNAAGYPASSVLPAGYRAPPATPLVAKAATPVAGQAQTPGRTRSVPAPAAPPATNPAGIVF